MTTVWRAGAWACGMAVTGALATVLANAAGTGWAISLPAQLWLWAMTAALLVTASALCRSLVPALVGWAVGSTWLVPELAGMAVLPAGLATAADAWRWILALMALLLASSALPAGRLRRAVLALAISGAAVGLATRVFLTQPLVDPSCWATCRSNPYFLDVGPTTHRAVDVVATTMLLVGAGVAAWSSRASLGDRRLVGVGTGLCAAVALGLAVPSGGPDSGPALALRMATAIMAVALGVHLLAREVEARRLRSSLYQLALGVVDSAGPDGPEAALRVAFEDPSVRVAYWAPARGGLVDAEGRALTASGGGRALQVRRAGAPIAVITTARGDWLDELASAVGPALRLALENAQLAANLRAELQDVDASRGALLEARLVERCRLERNLHDGAQQRVVTLILSLRLLARHVTGAARKDVERAADETERLVQILRLLARGIHPAVVSYSGLVGALRDLNEEHPSLRVRVRAESEPTASAAAKTLLYLLASAVSDRADEVGITTLCAEVSRQDDRVVLDLRHDGGGSLTPSREELAAAQAAAFGGTLDHRGVPGAWWLRLEVPCES